MYDLLYVSAARLAHVVCKVCRHYTHPAYYTVVSGPAVKEGKNVGLLTSLPYHAFLR